KTNLSQDLSTQAIGQYADIEVDQQARSQPRDSHVVENLLVVNRSELLDRLDLQYDRAPDNQVENLISKDFVPVLHPDALLPLKRYRSRGQLNAHRSRIEPFVKSRTKLAVDADATTDSVLNQLFDFIGKRTPYSEHDVSYELRFRVFRG